jgi:tetratricopeptide (TPR) repeat protein
MITALLDQAAALQAQGQFDHAEQLLKQAVTASPKNPKALQRLALLYKQAGNWPQAARYFARASQAAPQEGSLALQHGIALLELSLLEEAEPVLTKAAPKLPDFLRVLAYLALARLYLMRRAVPLMLATARKAFALTPGDVAAAEMLAHALTLSGEEAEAQRVLAQSGKSTTDSWRMMADWLEAFGLWEQARQAYAQAHTADPSQWRPLLQRANLERAFGQRDAALTWYRKALAAHPDSTEARLQTVLADPEAAMEMQEALQRDAQDARYSDAERSDLWFALAALLERGGDPQTVFAAYAEANRLRHLTSGYDSASVEAQAAQIRAIFTPALMARLNPPRATDARPIFIVGMPRSGSTLLARILASHPEVCDGGELAALPTILKTLPYLADQAGYYPLVMAQAKPPQMRALAKRYRNLTLPLLREGTSRLIDKQLQNFMHVGVIHLLFPNATIVHVQRDAQAVIWSIFRQRFAEGVEFATSLETIQHYHRIYSEMIAHWEQLLPGRMVHVDYAALVADPEPAIRTLLAQCELPWSESCLTPERTESRATATASAYQVASRIYSGADEAWKAYASFLRR